MSFVLEPKDELIKKKREKKRVDQGEADGEGLVWKTNTKPCWQDSHKLNSSDFETKHVGRKTTGRGNRSDADLQ